MESSEEISTLESHTQEVVSLDYSPFLDDEGNYILASGSRDRNIIIYEGAQTYSEINQLEGHSSSIISVRFAFDPDEKDESKRLKLLTCGADKTIIYRNVENPKSISIYHKEVLKTKMVAMEVQGTKVVSGHDKLVTVSDLRTHTRLYDKKPEKIKSTGPQDFHKVLLDRSETFLISASSDKFFTITDMISGTLVTRGTCGEITTALALSLDNKHLITTSSDGCIYFWRLNEQITKAMSQRQKEFGIQISSLGKVIEPSLRMPEVVKKAPVKSSSQLPKAKPVEDFETSPNKVLFSGKSPAEILFQK